MAEKYFMNFKNIFALEYRFKQGLIGACNSGMEFEMIKNDFRDPRFYMNKVSEEQIRNKLINCGQYLITKQMFEKFRIFLKEVENVLNEIHVFEKNFFNEILHNVYKIALDRAQYYKSFELEINGKTHYIVKCRYNGLIFLEKDKLHLYDDYNLIKGAKKMLFYNKFGG